MSLIDIISLLGFSQGILLGGIILFAHRSDRPTHLLGLFIITLSLRVIPLLLIRTPYGEEHSSVQYLPLYCWLLGMPLAYLYCRRLAGVLDWRRDGIHLLPGTLEFIILSTLFILDVNSKSSLLPLEQQRGFFIIYAIVAIVPAIYYLYHTLRFLRGQREYLTSYYSNLTDRDLAWLRNTLYAVVIFAPVYALLAYGFLPVTPEFRIAFGAVVNTIIIYYVSIHGVRQLILRPRPPAAAEGEPAGDQHKSFRELEEYMVRSKAYLEPNLTLGDLGKRIGQSERNLSRIINEGSGKNFNTYINYYRIAAAREMLVNPAYDRYNMEGIAGEAGFNNRTSFYTAFRRAEEVSPAAYRKMRGKNM